MANEYSISYTKNTYDYGTFYDYTISYGDKVVGGGSRQESEFQSTLSGLYSEWQQKNKGDIAGLSDIYYELYGLDAAKELFGDTYTPPSTSGDTTTEPTPIEDNASGIPLTSDTGVEPIGYGEGEAGLGDTTGTTDTTGSTTGDTSGISDAQQMISDALNEIASGGDTGSLDRLAEMYNTSATNLYNLVQQELQKLDNTANTLQAQTDVQNQLAALGTGKAQTAYTAQNITEKMQEMAQQRQKLKRLPIGTEQTKTGAALLQSDAVVSKPTLLGI